MKQDKLNLLISLDSFTINHVQSITGDIYFTYHHQSFPDVSWNDFVVVILSWWNRVILQLSYNRHAGDEEKLRFMDGPYYIKCICLEDNHVSLHFIKDKMAGEELLFSVQINKQEFKDIILKSTDKVLKEMKKRNWHTDDVRELEKLYQINFEK